MRSSPEFDSYPRRATFVVILMWLCGPAGAFGVVTGSAVSPPVKVLGVAVALAWTTGLSFVLARLVRARR